MATLQIENITKTYKNKTVLDDFRLHLQEGELMSLIGPSGCGKSTLLKIIAGIVSPDAGRILIGERDVTTCPAHTRNAVLVFQDYHLFPHLTVEENIGFGLKMRGMKPARIDPVVHEMLERVQLHEHRYKHPRQLSGGQQQRTALARALAIAPEVLLLDEPFSNLDPALRQQMRELLLQLQKQLNITTLLVTHDREEAMLLSDRITVLLQHRPEQVGTPEEIYHFPRTRQVADYFGASAYMTGHIENGLLITDFYERPVHADPGTVQVLIRPEDVVTDCDGIPYRIVAREYLGDSCLYTLARGAHRLRMRTHPMQRMDEGTTVRVQVRSNTPVFFPV